MTDRNALDTHIEASLVATYVDGRATSAEVETVEAHLAECADCRREVIEVRRLLSRRSRRWAWSAVAVLGAAAVLLLVVNRPGGEPAADGSTTRGGAPSVLPTPTVLAPAEGVTIPRAAMRFMWSSVEGAAAYRLTLTDERGDEVWTNESADTTVAPAPSVRLLGDHTYYWSVDVLLSDGRSTTTGFHSFRVAP